TPWGILVVCIILGALVANAFGVFEIRLPGIISKRLGGRAGIGGAFVMGMLMGVVATPCVGAFLAALILPVASKASVVFGAVSFFALGLGLGLPYLLLGTFTGLISRVPRGGVWLPWAKKILGLFIVALIMWFLHPFIMSEMFWPMVLLLVIASGLYVGLLEGRENRPWSRGFLIARIIAMVIILAAGTSFYLWRTADRPQVEWGAIERGELDAARVSGKPVILFFTADLCPGCETWKARVFSDADVIAESERFERILVDTTVVPKGWVQKVVERYNGQNPPLIVVMDSSGKVVDKPLRDTPTPEEFIKLLKKVPDK
ncbi:MAG: cytochrome c biogenesis protein CcdA, partial [Planctomycetia bacterium]|nr:cytochrome c biogenesis protein CcdA [Planctomycetia bacterium]